MLPSLTEAAGSAAAMSLAVRGVPVAGEPRETATVAGMPASNVARPEAIACFALPSCQRLFTTTWAAARSSAGVPGMSPLAKPRPTVKGSVPLVAALSWKEVTWLPGTAVQESAGMVAGVLSARAREAEHSRLTMDRVRMVMAAPPLG